MQNKLRIHAQHFIEMTANSVSLLRQQIS